MINAAYEARKKEVIRLTGRIEELEAERDEALDGCRKWVAWFEKTSELFEVDVSDSPILQQVKTLLAKHEEEK